MWPQMSKPPQPLHLRGVYNCDAASKQQPQAQILQLHLQQPGGASVMFDVQGRRPTFLYLLQIHNNHKQRWSGVAKSSSCESLMLTHTMTHHKQRLNISSKPQEMT